MTDTVGRRVADRVREAALCLAVVFASLSLAVNLWMLSLMRGAIKAGQERNIRVERRLDLALQNDTAFTEQLALLRKELLLVEQQQTLNTKQLENTKAAVKK